MKALIVALVLFIGFFSKIALGDDIYIEKPADINKVFVPGGFDDNDQVEVVLSGVLADSCHTVGNSGYTVDPETNTVRVWATTMVKQNTFCLEMITFYVQPIKVGQLKVGEYSVQLEDRPELEESISIAEATSENPDEFLYAPTKKAMIKTDENGRQSLIIEGNYPYFFEGCMVLREVRTRQDPEDVLIVQPIAEMTEGVECDDQADSKAFKMKVGLSAPLNGRALLHVKGFDGQTLNQLHPGF
jgi:hypothetical protein